MYVGVLDNGFLLNVNHLRHVNEHTDDSYRQCRAALRNVNGTLSTFDEDTVNTVLAPTGLRSAIYSAMAAEIYWARSSTSGLQ